MRNALAAAALMLLTAACGSYQFPGASPSPQAAHVSGSVLSWPCAPVERADSPCPGRPVAGVEIDYVAGNSVVSRVMTNSRGAYSVDLRPGTYEVKMVTYMRVVSGPTRLTLGAGTQTVADYVLDNGIRAPVPQQ